MSLRLQVISVHRESMGGSYIQEFAACGGTIGRSLDCDWPLSDSKRYVSSRHAMIDFQSGAYYLVDLSRNGVYVNGANAPVGTGNPQRLFDGDTFRLGEFEISVAIIEAVGEGYDDGMRDTIVRAQLVPEDESEEISLLSPDQLSNSVPLTAMLEPDDITGQMIAFNEPPANAPQPATEPNPDMGIEAAAEEFLRAAGLDPRQFVGIDPATLLKNAAHLLAQFAEGTHDLLRNKDQLAKDMTNPNFGHEISNPLRSSDSIDNALRLLLAPGNDVHMTGTRAIEAAFRELQQHQDGVVAAMRNALDDYIGFFEPRALDKLFDQQKQRTGRTPKNFRELYTQAYQGLSRPNKNRLPQRFNEEFARAYEIETTN